MGQTARHIIFIGQVQGIGFRFTALNTANRFLLTGWVRNLPGGNVEMIAQGSDDDIDNCIRGIKEAFGDNVRETIIKETAFDPRYTNFKITF